jgi:hypothetical protein
MNNLLRLLFRSLEQQNIQYCLLRDAEHLDQLEGEVDLLVQESELTRCAEVLVQLGFLPLPSFGYTPHHFFVAYDSHSDQWFKCDVVTQVAFGSPIPVISTDLGEACLQERHRHGDTFIPAPEYELITLLMHCVLDKGYFAHARRQRLAALRHLVADELSMTSLLNRYWLPTLTWATLVALMDAGEWDALLAQRESVWERVVRHNRFITKSQTILYRLQRKLNRWITANSPRSLKIALLAPDGAGKSMLVQGIRATYYFPVRSIYMGLYQKGSSNGKVFELPGLGFAARLSFLWWRYFIAQYHQSRRRLVIFDRYTYDFLLPPDQPTSKMKRWRRWIFAHACPPPDLTIVLDAPGEVLYARKGEHSSHLLEKRRQQYLLLGEKLKKIVVVDAGRDAEQVRRDVMSLIWDSHVQRQTGVKRNRLEEAATT